ncbi:integral membrane [Pyrenophora seminiperda CCB06]|uniref:Integral membrane n=1 Tax=Pyrenophora seminiperda CCB06 TaxID=1302712 RepID=A0A3M7M204_9PLEO|nr:integral membrane [Pyrenophora seminiperda CCB06]
MFLWSDQITATTAPNPLDPKYAPGAEQARQDIMLSLTAVLTIIAVLCVALRVYTRGIIVRNMGPEDWTMIAAAVFAVVYLMELVVGAKELKLGFSAMSITVAQLVASIKLSLAIVITYMMAMTLIKISILLIYLRLAVTQTFKRLCQVSVALLVVYQVIVTIVVFTQCTPINKLWDFFDKIEGTCIDARSFYRVTSVFHMIMDLWILVLPVKLIMNIPRPPREKIALYVIFGLGIVSLLASVLRFQSLHIFTLSNDPAYDSLPINTWSMVEINVGILCASIPTLKPLVSKAQRNRTQNALRHSTERATERAEKFEKFGKMDKAQDVEQFEQPEQTTAQVQEPPKAAKWAWPRKEKSDGFGDGDAMLISLHPLASGDRQSYDMEWEMANRMPPVPSNDGDAAPQYPNMTHTRF